MSKQAIAKIDPQQQERGIAVPRETPAQVPAVFASIFAPANRREAMELCTQLSREQWVPKSFRNAPMFVAIALEFGERHGLSPMASLTNIAMINGKPSLYGDIAMAVCRKADPHIEYTEELHMSGEGKNAICVGCTVTVRRGGEGEVHTESFMRADAERAGLLNKDGPWRQYPQRMFMARARGFALRTMYPDVLSGYITAEEAMDYPTQQERQQQRQQRAIKPHPDTVMDADMFPVKHNTSHNETPETSETATMGFDAFVKMVLGAGSTAELKHVAEHGKRLNKDDKARAKHLYSTRLKELRDAEKAFVDETMAKQAESERARSKEVLDSIMSESEDLPSVDDIPTPEQQWGDMAQEDSE